MLIDEQHNIKTQIPVREISAKIESLSVSLACTDALAQPENPLINIVRIIR